jgi:uncharacterized membrane protein
VFIGFFFFTYASRVEKNVVETRTKSIIRDLMKDVRALTPEGILKGVSPLVNKTLQPPDMTRVDEKVTENNKELLKKAALTLAILFVIGMVLTVVISRYTHIPLKPLFITNFISLLFVAITEFSFLTFFAQNYITVDANYVKKTAIQAVIDYGN